MSDELLTTAEVGQMLKVAVTTLRQWRARHLGPPGFAVGGTVRYRKSAVERWLAEQEQAAAGGRVSA